MQHDRSAEVGLGLSMRWLRIAVAMFISQVVLSTSTDSNWLMTG